MCERWRDLELKQAKPDRDGTNPRKDPPRAAYRWNEDGSATPTALPRSMRPRKLTRQQQLELARRMAEPKRVLEGGGRKPNIEDSRRFLRSAPDVSAREMEDAKLRRQGIVPPRHKDR